MALSLPARAASYIWGIFQPTWLGRGRRRICCRAARALGSFHREVAGALVGLAAHVGGALHVVLSAQGVHAHAGRPMLPVIMAMSAICITVKVP
jgi:hypothetical protein